MKIYFYPFLCASILNVDGTWKAPNFIFALGLLLFIFNRSAYAQQVCYSYDAMGRLVGVVDQNQQAAFYDYDAVGNILSIRRQSSSGPVTIYSVDPPNGVAGSLVEIFGVGFSQTANQNVVTIGGVPMPVVSVTGCTLVIQVSDNASTGQLTVTTPSGQATSNLVFSTSRIDIPSTTAVVLINGTVQFTTIITGCSDPQVIWSVDGVVGGNSTLGTISTTGLYTAPSTVPSSPQLIIRADSVGCANLFAEVPLTVGGQLVQLYASASVSYGTPVLSFPANVIRHSASVSFGPPPVGAAGGTILHAVSVADGAAITGLSQNSATRGSNFTLTVNGSNLSGAFDLEFHLATGFFAIIAHGGGNSGLTVSPNTSTTSGCGSGGAIRLITNTFSQGNGAMDARSVCAVQTAGDGRIRLEFFQGSTGQILSSLSQGIPGQIPVLPGTNFPSVKITAIGGSAVPPNPQAAFLSAPDTSLDPNTTPNPVTVNLQASNVTLGTVIVVSVVTEGFTKPTVVNSTALTGTLASSAATANVTLPPGVSVISATAAP